MHIYVIAGHGAGDSGATGHGYTEAERVRALAARIKELGGDSVTVHPTSDNAYASGAINTLDIPKGWPIVELHMDSGAASARGGHVIIKAGIGGADAYDKALAAKVSAIFPGRASTIVERSDLANPNRAYKRGYNYRLVENGFISNAGDVETFNSRLDDLARAYLDAFGIEHEPEKAQLPEALQGFIDLDGDAWYVSAVEQAVKSGWMDGYGNGTFGPNDPLTRAQACAALSNHEGETHEGAFADVEPGNWYYDAVTWAEERGIVSGTGDGKFDPDGTCTREAFVAMLHNLRGKPAPAGHPTGMPDWAEVSGWARDAVAWAVERGVIGSTGRIRPQDACTRAEACAILCRI